MDDKQIHYPQVVSVGCGIDVHQNLMVATIRSSTENYETKSFEGYTKFFDSVKRVVQVQMRYAYSYGKHGGLLEARI
jgi:hypothetical protein